MATAPLGLPSARRETLARRVRLLVAATISYNVIEAGVALAAGAAASSTALIGFGLDSVIEVSSAAAVAWQFSAADHETREAREHTALRIIAASFFALAAYITVDAGRALLGGTTPGPPLSGSCSPRSRSLLCRCCRPSNAGPVASWGQLRRYPTPSRPCCAPTCLACCCSAWSPTLSSAGLGPTLSQPLSSPPSP
jgi:hypothetical protein